MRSLALAAFVTLTSPAYADVPACIGVRAEARYGAAGYNHIVYLTSSCAKTFVCAVSTDVNPQSTTVTVPPGRTVDVVTFLGSPATVFVPKVSCMPAKT
jgi:hypothetical protein